MAANTKSGASTDFSVSMTSQGGEPFSELAVLCCRHQMGHGSCHKADNCFAAACGLSVLIPQERIEEAGKRDAGCRQVPQQTPTLVGAGCRSTEHATRLRLLEGAGDLGPLLDCVMSNAAEGLALGLRQQRTIEVAHVGEQGF